MNIEKEILEIKKAQSENGAMMKLILQNYKLNFKSIII